MKLNKREAKKVAQYVLYWTCLDIAFCPLKKSTIKSIYKCSGYRKAARYAWSNNLLEYDDYEYATNDRITDAGYEFVKKFYKNY